MFATQDKQLFIQYAPFYKNYKYEFEKNLCINELYNKYCYMYPSLAEQYIAGLDHPQSEVTSYKKKVIDELFTKKNPEKLFPEKVYNVIGLGAGTGEVEMYFVEKLRSLGKDVHLFVNDASLWLTKYALKHTDAEAGFCSDFLKSLEHIRMDIFSLQQKNLPCIYFMSGYTFCSLSISKLTLKFRQTMQQGDMFVFDSLLYDKDSYFTLYHEQKDHLHISPMTSEKNLKNIASFYGLPVEDKVQFRLLHEQDHLIHSIYRKNFVLRFLANTSLQFRDSKYRFMKGESFSLYKLRSFSTSAIQEILVNFGIEYLTHVDEQEAYTTPRILYVCKKYE